MAFLVTEYLTSRRVHLAKDTENADLEFVGVGSSDDAVARAGFLSAVPTVFRPFSNDLPLLHWDCAPMGGLFWRAWAHYGPDGAPPFPAVGGVGPPTPVAAAPGPNSPIGPDFAFDFEGVTERVYQSKETVLKVKRGGGAAPDNKGAIQVTADGKVEGCERLSPKLTWSRTVTFASVTLQYLQTVAGLVGNANDAAFYNRPRGSVTFLGGNCQIDDTYKAKCTFKFWDRKNETAVPICEGFSLTVPPPGRLEVKLGSEYLWVGYKDDPTGNRIWQTPDAAYVERVVDLVDFGQLRIGV